MVGDKCGDSVTDVGEECDDGNTENFDECSNACTIVVHRKVFVSSGTWSGDLKGLMGADGKCNVAAGLAVPKLDGTFRAWLSTEGDSNAANRIGTSFTGVYELVSGTRIANGWDGLTKTLEHAIDMDENGAPVAGQSVWTNTTELGASATAFPGTGHCAGWTSTQNGIGGINKPYVGDSSSTNSAWTKNGDAMGCGTERRIYCFQVGP